LANTDCDRFDFDWWFGISRFIQGLELNAIIQKTHNKPQALPPFPTKKKTHQQPKGYQHVFQILQNQKI